MRRFSFFFFFMSVFQFSFGSRFVVKTVCVQIVKKNRGGVFGLAENPFPASFQFEPKFTIKISENRDWFHVFFKQSGFIAEMVSVFKTVLVFFFHSDF